MFFIRTAFWVSLVVMLMPADERRQADLYGSATAAVQWTATFCDRNVDLCSRSGEFWQTFKQKAEFSARLAGDLIQKNYKKAPAGSATTSGSDASPNVSMPPATSAAPQAAPGSTG